jgi:hypothetical protein
MKRVSFVPKPAAGRASAQSPDQWVASQAPTEPTKRLTIDVPLSLHKRIKSQCAIEELVMADVIRELLEKRFPERAGEMPPS